MRGCRYDRDGVRNPDSSHFHNSKRHHDGESPSYGNQDGRLSLAGDRDAKPLGHDPHDTLYSNTNLRKRSCGKPTKSGSGKPGANGNSYKPIALRWPFLVVLLIDLLTTLALLSYASSALPRTRQQTEGISTRLRAREGEGNVESPSEETTGYEPKTSLARMGNQTRLGFNTSVSTNYIGHRTKGVGLR